ncbi:apoptosis-antagonizing transcription factor [Tribonema minus]|uniref:Apoptosis-antagonizing transcription factor n=1 Tax=Tribonema minus TaxID=303371 RepID=A0A835Z0N8_9STRA|nr:apoptosis-antagonizing transcription factor [Tribonema minus]
MDLIGEEYGAKKVSRRALQQRASAAAASAAAEEGSSDQGSSDEDQADNDDAEADDGSDASADDGQAYGSQQLQDEGSSASDDDQGDGGGGPLGSDNDDESDDSDTEANADQSNVFLGGGGGDDMDKFRAAEALRQRRWWDGYLEVRILLQRLLDTANRAPPPRALPAYRAAEPALAPLAAAAAARADALAAGLSALRKGHMRQAGIAVGGGDGQEEAGGGVPEGGGGDTIWEDALADYRRCRAWWERCVERWQRRTAALSPALQRKFKAVNQGVWAQVEASMADKERARRKLFALRADTDARCFGRFIAPPSEEAALDSAAAAAAAASDDDIDDGERNAAALRASRWRADPIDCEVLDDRELYHHQLKEFVEGGEGGRDGAAAAAAAAAAARLRQRKRRKVDRRASKGRKLRYEVHAKLQNFAFPQEYGPPPMDADELFASLFGRSRSSAPINGAD